MLAVFLSEHVPHHQKLCTPLLHIKSESRVYWLPHIKGYGFDEAKKKAFLLSMNQLWRKLQEEAIPDCQLWHFSSIIVAIIVTDGVTLDCWKRLPATRWFLTSFLNKNLTILLMLCICKKEEQSFHGCSEPLSFIVCWDVITSQRETD